MSAGAVNKMTNDKPDNVRGKTLFFFGFAGMVLFGWIAFPILLYKSVEQPVQFSHRTHIGDNVALKCDYCHQFDKDGRFLGIPQTEKCSGCHSRSVGTSAEEARFVREYIDTGRKIAWIVYSRQPRNVWFSHAAHVKLAGLDCGSCHSGQSYSDRLRPARFSRISGYSLDVFGQTVFNIPSTPSRGMRMDDCVSCHRERGLKESCIGCHK